MTSELLILTVLIFVACVDGSEVVLDVSAPNSGLHDLPSQLASGRNKRKTFEQSAEAIEGIETARNYALETSAENYKKQKTTKESVQTHDSLNNLRGMVSAKAIEAIEAARNYADETANNYRLSIEPSTYDKELQSKIIEYEKQDKRCDDKNILLLKGNVLAVPTSDSSPASPAKKVSGTKKASPAKKVSGTKKASPAKNVSGTKKASPAKKVSGTKKASPAKNVSGTKKNYRSRKEVKSQFDDKIPNLLKDFDNSLEILRKNFPPILQELFKAHLPLSCGWRDSPPSFNENICKHVDLKRFGTGGFCEKRNYFDDGSKLLIFLQTEVPSLFTRRLNTEEMAFHNNYGNTSPYTIARLLGWTLIGLLQLEEQMITCPAKYKNPIFKAFSKYRGDEYIDMHADIHKHRRMYIMKPFVAFQEHQYKDDLKNVIDQMKELMLNEPIQWTTILSRLLDNNTLWRQKDDSFLEKCPYLMEKLTDEESVKMIQARTKEMFRQRKDNGVKLERTRLQKKGKLGRESYKELEKLFIGTRPIFMLERVKKHSQGTRYNFMYDEAQGLQEQARFSSAVNYLMHPVKVFNEQEIQDLYQKATIIRNYENQDDIKSRIEKASAIRGPKRHSVLEIYQKEKLDSWDNKERYLKWLTRIIEGILELQEYYSAIVVRFEDQNNIRIRHARAFIRNCQAFLMGLLNVTLQHKQISLSNDRKKRETHTSESDEPPHSDEDEPHTSDEPPHSDELPHSDEPHTSDEPPHSDDIRSYPTFKETFNSYLLLKNQLDFYSKLFELPSDLAKLRDMDIEDHDTEYSDTEYSETEYFDTEYVDRDNSDTEYSETVNNHNDPRNSNAAVNNYDSYQTEAMDLSMKTQKMAVKTQEEAVKTQEEAVKTQEEAMDLTKKHNYKSS
eukprot:GHVL01007358.1.p1 GENE.GHVL01007358.1~~GHVL01007358.1.p1  ORF type:complete len:899 (-),score=126.15 GHVL01007358.1:58-2754(-)